MRKRLCTDAEGTVQVTHHGARDNWKTEMGDGDLVKAKCDVVEYLFK